MIEEKPKDRDFIETIEGLLFCVLSYLHPLDRITAFLKYIPSSTGKWKRGEVYLKRVVPFYHVSEVKNTYKFLEDNYPEYLFDCPVRNIKVSAVTYTRIKNYYRPQDRLTEIIDYGPNDVLEAKLKSLVEELSDLTSVDVNNFGVTGSILTKNHNPVFSDIDLTIHGLKNVESVRNTIRTIRNSNKKFRSYNEKEAKKWIQERTGRFPLRKDELLEIIMRRWTYSMYAGTYVSFHAIRKDNEIEETYGDRTYRGLFPVKGTAIISGNKESVFLPAIYDIKEVKIEKYTQAIADQLVSYEGIFSDIFREGEKVEFEGIFEEIRGVKNYNRVVVGAADFSGGYIRIIH